jgi:tight adherence protein C
MPPLSELSPMLIATIFVAVGAILIAGLALASMLRQRDVLRRAKGDAKEEILDVTVSLLTEPDDRSRANALTRLVPDSVGSSSVRLKLLRAGIESNTAPQAYFLFRLLSVTLFPLLAWVIVPSDLTALFVLSVGIGLFAGFIAPVAMLDRLVRVRQEAITRSVPDALDLLVVCVEAGISLDAAILRVSRELRFLHPALSSELGTVNRLTNAGVTRERALRGLYERTGVEELRTIASSMVQSEKLGTSIGTVLRVAAETLRRKRRQSAEKRAKQAPVKMIFPLLFFILPALFVVVLGPAIFVVIKEMSKI